MHSPDEHHNGASFERPSPEPSAPLHGAHAGPEEIAAALAYLERGLLVAFPTETVYGLGASAFNASAVARVFEAKGRPAHNPLIVHVSSEEMARTVASQWPRDASLLARAFWPGPLSIVVAKSQSLPPIVTAGGTTVALRCPSHPITLALIDAFGEPLVGPSANLSGGVSPTSAEHVRGVFDPRFVYVLDGGPSLCGIESTVIDLSGKEPVILRPGMITQDQIARVLMRDVHLQSPATDAPASAEPLRSPGLLDRHYAPRTPTFLVTPDSLPAARDSAPGAVVVIGVDGLVPGELTLPADARGYAAGLYAALRSADASSAARILIVVPPMTGPDLGLWDAIMDRLRRASAPLP